MIVERFFNGKKDNEFNKDIEVCDDVVALIEKIWLKDIKHRIEYEYFKDVNNTIIKVYLYDNIGNFNINKGGVNMHDNIDIIMDFMNFFKDKTDFILRAYSNNSMQSQLICWNNIDDIKNELRIISESKKYNL
jgi:hypothetical protein